jgi:hypothetical protein
MNDVTVADARLEEKDSQVARRDVIRATFSAIEGMLWRTKQGMLSHASRASESLSAHELAALKEESYVAREDGRVSPQPRYLPTAISIRVAARVAEKLFEGYKVDFGLIGWECLQRAIDVRNRILHPKTRTDLHISDKEIADCRRGYGWLIAFVILAEHQMIKALEAELKRVRLLRVTRRDDG